MLPLSKGITAIVGPNGSGKSNILDAIKWVLGEQSPKRLRVKDLNDLIFSGNSDKKIDFAEVKLVLSHEPPIFEKYKDLEEIVIIRRFYRDGEGEFFINNRACRLKDIHFLFLDLGVNPQSYGIIDQGEINKFLEISPKERKRFLEDLAGITKLKVTEEETEKNIFQTEQNLIRLTDILKEVESQYYHLKEQAETARKYLTLKEDLKKYSLIHLGLLYKQALEKKRNILEKINEVKLKKISLEKSLERIEDEEREVYKEILNLERQSKDLKKDKVEKEEELKKIEEKLSGFYKEESKITQKLEQEKIKESTEIQRKNLLLQQIELIKKELETKKEKAENFEIILRDLKAKRDKLLKELSEKQKKKQKLNQEYDAIKKEGIRFREKKDFLERELSFIHKELALKEGEAQEIEDSQNKLLEEKELLEKIVLQKTREREDLEREIVSLKNSSDALKAKLKEVQEKKRELISEKKTTEEKIRLLSQILNSEERNFNSKLLEKTIGNYLKHPLEDLAILENYYGDLLKAIIINDIEEINSIIEKEKGNLIFVKESALSSIPFGLKKLESKYYTSESIPEDFVFLKDKKLLISPQGFILYLKDTKKGYFSLKREKELFEKNLVAIDEKLTQLNESELFIKEELNKIEKILFDKEKKKIEKDEEIKKINITLSQFEQKRIRLEENLKGIRENLQTLLKRKEHLEGEKKELEGKINRISQNESELSKLIKELLEEIKNFEGEKNRVESEISEAEKKVIKIKAEKEQLFKRKDEIISEIESIDRFLKNTKHNYEILLNEVNYLREKINEERKKKELLKSTLKVFEEQIASSENLLMEKNSFLRDILNKKKIIEKEKEKFLQNLHSLELDLTEVNLNLENLKRELRELIGEDANPEDLLKDMVNPLNLQEIEKKLEELKGELKNFPEVNLTSIKEFERIAERYDTLLSQKKDLENAIEHLKKILKELRVRAEKQLLATLKSVNEKLREIFPLIMEKVTAELYLTEEDPLKAGLELKLSSPYKNIKHLHMLSGGEKALCVISILIAFYLTKPGPFCILDEVDAPLDEKNSLKFIRLMKKIKENSQIILITHNIHVMKEVDHLVGVTMEEKGVSKLVKLNVKD
ncbi:hypothetical protein THC_0644 [Caldimicrobium thiodismutans]|uniref:RecF/RecN/SMC N-terminal domain-containing protein n=1 Tax=Caldimicrobium thiodismutans TaxID=1653476 RepID=A0A0U5AGB4_9BACT|nr:hypothetical protein THC_0644 [Caldimicrobium thiodismutans]